MPQQIQNYIGGELLPASSGLWLDNMEPATGTPYSQVPDSDGRDIEAAVIAAHKVFLEWASTPVVQRAKVLRKIAGLIEQNQEALAKAESVDTGKPLCLAASIDIPRSVLNFEFFADAITQFASECHESDELAINYTLRKPLGVVACISPWNLPLYLLTWKLAPALATGNCVIAKPSEITPMSAYLLSQICMEAGLPPGVLNIVHGLGHKVGAALSENPFVRAVSFTGSTRTGIDIARKAAPFFKKISLEMGGKNPALIFADCDFDEAVDETLRGAFSNQGQICLCTSRILIEKPMYEKFKAALLARVKALKIGDPLLTDTDQGALVSQAHFEKVLSFIELAHSEGGQILTGGNRTILRGRCENGWFLEPTLIEGLPSSSKINQEEIFGPVATLIPFNSEEEACAIANSTRYGLAASIWTRDIKRANRVTRRLQAGIVWINCWMFRDLRTPFGGVKDSGVGREGGLEALHFFTEPKNVCIKL